MPETIFNSRKDGGSAWLTDMDLALLKEQTKRIQSDIEQGIWERKDWVEEIRLCRWEGQSDDGRKHRTALGGKEPFPFEGASDARVRTADMIVNEQVATLMAAAKRAHLKLGGMEAGDEEYAARVRTLLGWALTGSMGRYYWAEMEKLGQWMLADAPAVAVMQVYWDQAMQLKPREIALEDLQNNLVEIFGQDRLDEVGVVLDRLLDPEREGESVGILKALIPISSDRARSILASWRKGEVAQFPEPIITRNQPGVKALRLFDDIFIPTGTGALKDASIIIRRQWLRKWELEAKKVEEGWSESFIESLLGKQGASGLAGKSAFKREYRPANSAGEWVKVGLDDDKEERYEVLWAYWRQVNEDGVVGIYQVPYSMEVDEAAKEKELLKGLGGQYPFVEFPREWLTERLLDARSVPELVMTDQQAEKTSHDSISNHAALSSVPPLRVPLGRPSVPLLIQPIAQIPEIRSGEISWMPPPEYPRTAETHLKATIFRRNEYFGRHSGEIPQELTVLHKQQMVNRFLASLADVMKMVVQLCIEYLSDEELSRIVGGRGLQPDRTEAGMMQMFDLSFDFDVRTLDGEYVEKLAQSISQTVLAWDTSQTVQRDRLTRFILSAINPQLADYVLRPEDEADTREIEDEELNYVKMSQGLEPPMVERGQNFGLRLKWLDGQVARDPERILAWDEKAQELLQKRLKHLSFMTSQEKNKMIGRLGVAPEETREGE